MGAVVEAVVEAIVEEVVVFGPSICKVCKISSPIYTQFKLETLLT